MKQKTLGKIASELWYCTMDTSPKKWKQIAAAVIAEHERRKWRPMATCPACGEEIIAGFRDDGEEWVQTMGDAATLRKYPKYTHWQYAPEGPK